MREILGEDLLLELSKALEGSAGAAIGEAAVLYWELVSEEAAQLRRESQRNDHRNVSLA